MPVWSLWEVSQEIATLSEGLVLPCGRCSDLKGLEEGATEPTAMIDGKVFNGAKHRTPRFAT